MKTYQMYAVDENKTLIHAGILKRRHISIAVARKYQREWEGWREKYLVENPGNYPLREKTNPVTMIIAHEVGHPDKAICIPIA